MQKSHKKKTNPRNIPISKSELDTKQLTRESSNQALYRAWLLFLAALTEIEPVNPGRVMALWESVQKYSAREVYAIRAGEHRELGVSKEVLRKVIGPDWDYPTPNAGDIKSELDLRSFKRRLDKFSQYRAYRIFCAAMLLYEEMTVAELEKVFFNMDLSVAEIEHGSLTYGMLKEKLLAEGIKVSNNGLVEVVPLGDAG